MSSVYNVYKCQGQQCRSRLHPSIIDPSLPQPLLYLKLHVNNPFLLFLFPFPLTTLLHIHASRSLITAPREHLLQHSNRTTQPTLTSPQSTPHINPPPTERAKPQQHSTRQHGLTHPPQKPRPPPPTRNGPNQNRHIPPNPPKQPAAPTPPKTLHNNLHSVNLRPPKHQSPAGDSSRDRPRHSRLHRDSPVPDLHSAKPSRDSAGEFISIYRRRRRGYTQSARGVLASTEWE